MYLFSYSFIYLLLNLLICSPLSYFLFSNLYYKSSIIQLMIYLLTYLLLYLLSYILFTHLFTLH